LSSPFEQLYSLTFPVAAISGSVPDESLMVFGSSFFSKSHGCFVTAGHVLETAIQVVHESGYLLVVGQPDFSLDQAKWVYAAIEHLSVHGLYDVGVFGTRDPVFTISEQSISSSLLDAMSEIAAIGFAHAVDAENRSAEVRAFRSSIVGMRPFRAGRAELLCYELQVQAPRGLSGAPVFRFGDYTSVEGMVIGNQTIEMITGETEETVDDRKHEIHTVTDRLNLGIAITSPQLEAVLGDSGNFHSLAIDDQSVNLLAK